jgi:hypothetical protein
MISRLLEGDEDEYASPHVWWHEHAKEYPRFARYFLNPWHVAEVERLLSSTNLMLSASGSLLLEDGIEWNVFVAGGQQGLLIRF